MFSEGGPEGPKDEALFVLTMFPDGVMLCDPQSLAAAPPPKLRKAQPRGPFKILYKILIRWFG
jgi:hypothetical protein